MIETKRAEDYFKEKEQVETDAVFNINKALRDLGLTMDDIYIRVKEKIPTCPFCGEETKIYVDDPLTTDRRQYYRCVNEECLIQPQGKPRRTLRCAVKDWDIQIPLVDAVRKLCIELKHDGDYYRAYQANIAMAFLDTLSRHGFQFPDMHAIGNEAAQSFLNLLIGEPPSHVDHTSLPGLEEDVECIDTRPLSKIDLSHGDVSYSREEVVVKNDQGEFRI